MKTVLDNVHWQETRQRIESVTPLHPRLWRKMSAHEMMVHCTDQVRLAIGEKSGPRINSWFLEKIVIRLVLWGMPAPKGKVETIPTLKQGAGGTAPLDFLDDRDRLVDAVERFRITRTEPFPHPAFGNLTRAEWGKLIWMHLDHHLRQFSA
jgi:hypothetical protein